MLGTLTTPCVIPLISSISGFPFPLEGFIKLNFDGASKGNPGLARYEGILQENQGIPLGLFIGHYGSTTNNIVEFTVLYIGFLLARKWVFIESR